MRIIRKEVPVLSQLRDILIENPVIAAVRSDEDLEKALLSRVAIVFVLYGSVITVPGICKRLIDRGKTVFVHMDMVEGLKGDRPGVEYIGRMARPAGIISTRVNVVKYSKQLGLETVLRVFLLDSLSLKTGEKNINEVSPDAVEVMPGPACRLLGDIWHVSAPVIAGGLIQNKEQILEALSGGAVAISTSASGLWSL